MEQSLEDLVALFKEQGYVYVPDTFSPKDEDLSEVEAGRVYACHTYGSTNLYLKGWFGQNSYECEDINEVCVSEEADLRQLQTLSHEQTIKLNKVKEMESLIGEAVSSYIEAANAVNLVTDCEWSTDPYTISDWLSSRC